MTEAMKKLRLLAGGQFAHNSFTREEALQIVGEFSLLREENEQLEAAAKYLAEREQKTALTLAGLGAALHVDTLDELARLFKQKDKAIREAIYALESGRVWEGMKWGWPSPHKAQKALEILLPVSGREEEAATK